MINKSSLAEMLEQLAKKLRESEPSAEQLAKETNEIEAFKKAESELTQKIIKDVFMPFTKDKQSSEFLGGQGSVMAACVMASANILGASLGWFADDKEALESLESATNKRINDWFEKGVIFKDKSCDGCSSTECKDKK